MSADELGSIPDCTHKSSALGGERFLESRSRRWGSEVPLRKGQAGSPVWGRWGVLGARPLRQKGDILAHAIGFPILSQTD